MFSSIDRSGRYAYRNQANIMQWNLARFAETLLPLLDLEPDKAVAVAMEVLDAFPDLYEQYWLDGMRQKLGLQTVEADDFEFIAALLEWMQKSRADFTNTFRDLSAEEPLTDDRYQDTDFQAWYSRWQERLDRNGQPKSTAYSLMQSVNPAVIPRNHRVEKALLAAEEDENFSYLHKLLAALAQPFEEKAEMADYRDPSPDDGTYRTFCGT